jgi:hypothetical protein
MTFFSFADFLTMDSEVYSFSIKGIFNTENGEIYRNTLSINMLIGIVSLISLTSIFLYKKRTLQIRLCIYNIILLFGLTGLLAFYIFDAANALNADIVFKFSITFPVISIILTYLAFRNIRKDDAIVKSLDRIR